MNMTLTIKAMNNDAPFVHVRYSREWNEIQVRSAQSIDYKGDEVGYFDCGHTKESKQAAINEAMEFIELLRRYAL